MSPVSDFSYINFRKAVIVSLVIAIILITFSFIWGNNTFFLLLNGDGGVVADFFFRYWTYAGDGLLWTVALIYMAFSRKWRLFPFFIAAVLFTTLLVQVSKKMLLPGEMRPYATIDDKTLIHIVEGVKIHSMNSFPSGHTATAFAFALIICLLVNRKYIVPVSLVGALLAGYSRIYLALHFPLDIGAGIIAAVLAVYAAVRVQEGFQKRYKADLPVKQDI